MTNDLNRLQSNEDRAIKILEDADLFSNSEWLLANGYNISKEYLPSDITDYNFSRPEYGRYQKYVFSIVGLDFVVELSNRGKNYLPDGDYSYKYNLAITVNGETFFETHCYQERSEWGLERIKVYSSANRAKLQKDWVEALKIFFHEAKLAVINKKEKEGNKNTRCSEDFNLGDYE